MSRSSPRPYLSRDPSNSDLIVDLNLSTTRRERHCEVTRSSGQDLRAPSLEVSYLSPFTLTRSRPDFVPFSPFGDFTNFKIFERSKKSGSRLSCLQADLDECETFNSNKNSGTSFARAVSLWIRPLLAKRCRAVGSRTRRFLLVADSTADPELNFHLAFDCRLRNWCCHDRRGFGRRVADWGRFLDAACPFQDRLAGSLATASGLGRLNVSVAGVPVGILAIPTPLPLGHARGELDFCRGPGWLEPTC